MKKFLTVVLILAIILLVGCGEEKKVTERSELDSKSKSAGVDKMIYASPERSCTCPIDMESIDRLIEVAEFAKSGGASFEQRVAAGIIYDELVSSGKLILVRSNTKVACYYSEAYRNFVPVVFFEGEFKGKRAYVLMNRLE